MLVPLLRYSLFDGPRPSLGSDASVWEAAVAEARREAVSALFYDAVRRYCDEGGESPLPPALLFRLASMAETVGNDNLRRLRSLKDFAAKVYGALGVDTTVVKGFSVARHYPERMHRESGDNDVWFPPEVSLRVDELMRDEGVAVDTKDPRHSSFDYGGICFENHRYLLYPRRVGDVGCDPRWQTVPLGSHVVALTPSHEALFVASHIEHHAVFFDEPVRLRHLVDWALMVRQLDYGEFREVKAPFEVSRFADLLTQYCVRLFDIPAPEGWKPLSLRALDAFEPMFVQVPPRHRWAVVRVWRRTWKYIRYGRVYREIYGQSPIRRFYWDNVTQALAQFLSGTHRESRTRD